MANAEVLGFVPSEDIFFRTETITHCYTEAYKFMSVILLCHFFAMNILNKVLCVFYMVKCVIFVYAKMRLATGKERKGNKDGS